MTHSRELSLGGWILLLLIFCLVYPASASRYSPSRPIPLREITADSPTALYRPSAASSCHPVILSSRKLDFFYDTKGRRIARTISTWTGTAYQVTDSRKFLYDGWKLVAEINATNNLPIRSYTWLGNELVELVQDGVSYLPGYDANGNLTALKKRNGHEIMARYEYGPFGILLKASGPMAMDNPIRFSSEYQDPITGLIYYGYRYYNPATQRWLSRDPIGILGGYNLYALANNDPVNGRDYLGLMQPPGFGGEVILSSGPSPEAISSADRAIAAGLIIHGADNVLGDASLLITHVNPLAGHLLAPLLERAAEKSESDLIPLLTRDFSSEETQAAMYTGPIIDAASGVIGAGALSKVLVRCGGALRKLAPNLPRIAEELLSAKKTPPPLPDSLPGPANISPKPNPLGNSPPTAVEECAETAAESTAPAFRTWNQFQAGTAGQFASRAEAAQAWAVYKDANGIVTGTTRSMAARSEYLRSLADNPNTASWMKPWLQEGRVPPGYEVDHIKPLSIGGPDTPANMRLQGTDLHRLHHYHYDPWNW